MVKVSFHKLNTVEEKKLLFAVIVARHEGKWIYVRHKRRNTWEIPGGHRKENEAIEVTASRELFEETGAKKFKLIPICIYSVSDSDEGMNCTKSFGQLFYSEVEKLDTLPGFEIGEVKLFANMPDDLTYPLIQPFLHKKALEFIKEL